MQISIKRESTRIYVWVLVKDWPWRISLLDIDIRLRSRISPPPHGRGLYRFSAINDQTRGEACCKRETVLKRPNVYYRFARMRKSLRVCNRTDSSRWDDEVCTNDNGSSPWFAKAASFPTFDLTFHAWNDQFVHLRTCVVYLWIMLISCTDRLSIERNESEKGRENCAWRKIKLRAFSKEIMIL